MVWGQSSANVPMMGGVGQLIFFGLLLVIGIFVSKRWGLMKTLPAVAVLALVPLLADADEIQLNTFQNGEVADADDVNENFNNLKTAIESSNGSFIITPRITEMTYNEAQDRPYHWERVYEISVLCENDEVAISGSCYFKDTIQWNNQSIDIYAEEAQIFKNSIENNGQFCSGAEGSPEATLTAQVNCLSK